MRVKISIFFFTTNVRPVTTLDDLRFMTSLPVVDLTSCSRYLIFLNAQSMVGPENRMLLGSCHWNGLMQGGSPRWARYPKFRSA